MEKPFARALAEHDCLAAQLQPWQIAVGHTYRSNGTIRLVQSITLSQIFGRVQEIRFEFGGLGRVLTGGGYLGNKQLAGGGLMYQMGSHYIDAVLFITQARDVSLHGGYVEGEDGLDIHSEANLALTLGDGRVVPFRALATSLQRTRNRISITYDCANVSFSPGNLASPVEIAAISGSHVGQIIPTLAHSPLTANATFALHWMRSLDAARRQDPNETSVDAFRVTTKALELVYSLGAPSI